MRPRDDVVSAAGLRKLEKSSGVPCRGVGTFFFCVIVVVLLIIVKSMLIMVKSMLNAFR